MDYPTEYAIAVRYGRAPIEDIISLAIAGKRDGITHPNNTPDAVLADLFGDYSDPREEIIRRDLATRHHEGGFGEGHRADRIERLGKDAEYRGIVDGLQLVDGSRLTICQFHNSAGEIVGHEIAWNPSHPLAGVNYLAHFTAAETKHFLNQISDHIKLD